MALTKVTSDIILDGTIANVDLASDIAVTGGQIADNAVTLAKMAGGTDGNLITYDVSGDPAYVATGAATNVLTSNGPDTAPTFQAVAAGGDNTPYFYAYVSADQAMADNTWTKAACNTVVAQTGSTYDNVTNFRWTPVVTGTYFIAGQVEIDHVGTDSYILRADASIYKNDSAEITVQLWRGLVSNTRTIGGTVSGIIVIDSASDYVELWGKMDDYSGSGRFSNADLQSTHFMGYKLII